MMIIYKCLYKIKIKKKCFRYYKVWLFKKLKSFANRNCHGQDVKRYPWCPT